jgi:large subunit ribosomal protein L27
MAHKTGKGSTKNGRDSNPKYLGVKIFGGQKAKAGNIIVRQKGTKYFPGNNAYLSRQFDILAKVDGVVKFERYNRDKQKVSVYPVAS